VDSPGFAEGLAEKLCANLALPNACEMSER
jgi:hypothetical protein